VARGAGSHEEGCKLMRKNPIELLLFESFLKYVDFKGKKECWDWNASVTKNGGYGQLHIKGKSKLAHRFSYEIFYGAIPEGAWICHKCNNPVCCNPTHLYVGDPFTNAQDRIAAGTVYKIPPRRGEANNKTKLTSKIVKRIRLALKKGISQKLIAKKYNVRDSSISAINTGKTWIHTAKNKSELFIGKGPRNTRLSKADVLEIRKMKGKNTEIAKHFVVCPSTIGKIKKHQRWEHV
jgi:hypothetical protein